MIAWLGGFVLASIMIGLLVVTLRRLYRNGRGKPFWHGWEPVVMPRIPGTRERYEMEEWLNQRCRGKWAFIVGARTVEVDGEETTRVAPTYFFKRPDDAFEFKMRWY